MPGGAGQNEKDGMLNQVRCRLPLRRLASRHFHFNFPMVSFSVVCDPALYAPAPPVLLLEELFMPQAQTSPSSSSKSPGFSHRATLRCSL